MSASDHERPLSDRERRVFGEIEANFIDTGRWRWRLRRCRLRVYWRVALASFVGVVTAIALVALAPPAIATVGLLTGVLGVQIGVLVLVSPGRCEHGSHPGMID
ncbi:MAG: hypothetical protein QOE89_2256 [Pseudonocardiales bacterium]|nr:hypothetical protein [Pseudonocardiales bacterium]